MEQALTVAHNAALVVLILETHNDYVRFHGVLTTLICVACLMRLPSNSIPVSAIDWTPVATANDSSSTAVSLRVVYFSDPRVSNFLSVHGVRASQLPYEMFC